jgi:laminin alpha 3/5
MDIHGKFEGGGVCQECRDNTEGNIHKNLIPYFLFQGINCNKCKPTFYRPAGKRWNETDVCRRKFLGW